MDDSHGREAEPDRLAARMLFLNFVSLHTTTTVTSLLYHSTDLLNFVHAAYNLAAHPEYMEPLREDVQSAISEEGWTKKGVMRMRKLDSFIKETMRMHPLLQCILPHNCC